MPLATQEFRKLRITAQHLGPAGKAMVGQIITASLLVDINWWYFWWDLTVVRPRVVLKSKSQSSVRGIAQRYFLTVGQNVPSGTFNPRNTYTG
jgi:hypothetical protein